jgi:hypothetical protein
LRWSEIGVFTSHNNEKEEKRNGNQATDVICSGDKERKIFREG